MKVHIILKKYNKTPLYIQIYEAHRDAILRGEVGPGMRLESIAQLKQSLCVSRNTVEMAYLQLLVEGFIYSKRRSGYFVSNLENYKPLGYSMENPDPLKSRNTSPINKSNNKSSVRYDFDPGSTDHELFPFKKWNKIEQSLMSSENRGILTYPESMGEKQLRIQISKYLKHSRGVNCHYDQIIVGAGTQPLIGLLCNLFKENLKVALEDPGYPAIRKAFEWNKCEIMPVSLKNNVVDTTKIINDPVPSTMVFLTPSNQHPMGGLLHVSEKLRLLKWAHEKEGFLIEDDYDSEFRYNTHPVQTMFALDSFDRVIYMGTFSKTLFPAMRISYMVLPHELGNKFKELEPYYSQTASKVHQLTLANFMEEGFYEQHIRKMRTLYGKKHQRMVEVIDKIFGDKAIIIGNQAGINFTMRIKLPDSESTIINKARKAGIIIYPVSFYEIKKRNNREYTDVLLGYGHMTLKEIEDAISILGKALL